MMRTRDKLDSYRVLAEALALLKDRPWRALLVGDGPARAEVEALMAPLWRPIACASPARCRTRRCRRFMPRADLYLWPAINEAYGMAFLEAQAAGLPVVAGRTGGVPAVVADGVTGLLTPVGDAAAFAAAVARLLDDAGRTRAPGGRRRAPDRQRTMTSAPRPMPWRRRCGPCDERRALRHPAPRRHRLERRAAACRASPTRR